MLHKHAFCHCESATGWRGNPASALFTRDRHVAPTFVGAPRDDMHNYSVVLNCDTAWNAGIQSLINFWFQYSYFELVSDFCIRILDLEFWILKVLTFIRISINKTGQQISGISVLIHVNITIRNFSITKRVCKSDGVCY